MTTEISTPENNFVSLLKKKDTICFEIEVLPINKAHSRLQRWGIMPKKRVLAIPTLTLNRIGEIAGMFLEIKPPVLDENTLAETNYRFLLAHRETATDIIAIAICGKPKKRLKSFLKRNLELSEMATLLAITQKQMNIPAFMSAICYISGMNILSPQISEPANQNQSNNPTENF